MLVNCPHCQLPYVKEQSYQRSCIYCWREEQGHKLGTVDAAFRRLQEEAKKKINTPPLQQVDIRSPDASLQMKLQATQLLVNSLEKEVSELKRKLAERPVPPPPPPSAGSLTQDSIRELITLCHPDKHSNSPLATKITQWLVSLRRR